jgi:hypothetical protein
MAIGADATGLGGPADALIEGAPAHDIFRSTSVR